MKWQEAFTFAEAEFLHFSWRIWVQDMESQYGIYNNIYEAIGGETYRDMAVEMIRELPDYIAVHFPHIPQSGAPLANKLQAMSGPAVNAMFTYLDAIELASPPPPPPKSPLLRFKEVLESVREMLGPPILTTDA